MDIFEVKNLLMSNLNADITTKNGPTLIQFYKMWTWRLVSNIYKNQLPSWSPKKKKKKCLRPHLERKKIIVAIYRHWTSLSNFNLWVHHKPSSQRHKGQVLDGATEMGGLEGLELQRITQIPMFATKEKTHILHKSRNITNLHCQAYAECPSAIYHRWNLIQ